MNSHNSCAFAYWGRSIFLKSLPIAYPVLRSLSGPLPLARPVQRASPLPVEVRSVSAQLEAARLSDLSDRQAGGQAAGGIHARDA